MITTKIETIPKPFLKWAGGKGQLLSQLDKLFPDNLGDKDFTYIEPFVGGGAMLFHVLQKFPKIKKVVINDINSYLMTAYQVIKDNPNELIKRLSLLEQQYIALETEETRKEFFLEARGIFNEKKLDNIDRTKYLIFLNRTCFNGLYRVNAKGKFNVPFGRYLNPTICNKENIMADSKALNSVEIIMLNGDFEQTLDYVDQGFAFFYFDPPYRPLNTTSSFNSYSKEDFNDDEQIRLGKFCAELNNILGVEWMLSNSDCSAKNPEDTFFEKLYANFFISRVNASRAINADPNKRGKLTELVISSYPPKEYGTMAAENTATYERFKPQKRKTMKKDFVSFMSQLQETNQTLDFFCDFKKIIANVAEVEMSLNTLNYLIGKDDLSQGVKEIWKRDSKVFEVLGILIAVRDEDRKPIVDAKGNVVLLKSYFESSDKVVEFLLGTGLADIFKSRRIKNLVDYVFGIETGLDTNARKNRSGHIMEDKVASILAANGIKYRKEVYSSEFPELSVLGTDEKRFDFLIETKSKKYLIEVNFYSGGGSKLNEVARAYTELAPKINSVKGYEFVWITDGIGWKSASSKLEEAYKTIPSVYNLTTINGFINNLSL